MFNCTKCGACCRNLHLSELYDDLHNGDGVCMYLDQESNLCTIYENRPLKCRVEEMYRFFEHTMTKEEYYEMNHASCSVLQSKTERRDCDDSDE